MTETIIPDAVLCDLHQVGVGEYRIDIVLQWQHAGEQRVGLAFARFEVANTTQDDRRAQAIATVLDILTYYPALPDDILIECPALVAAQVLSHEHEPQELLARLWVNPEIHADEFTAGNVTACFLANLADDGCFGRFAGLDVAAGLVQQNISPRVFFDEQITSIVFYDS